MNDIAKLLQSINLDKLLPVLQKITAALAGKTTQAEIITDLLFRGEEIASLLKPK